MNRIKVVKYWHKSSEVQDWDSTHVLVMAD
jgi:hypothetical protein